MSSNLYCPFCGIILLSEPYLDPEEFHQTRARPWYADVRAVYSRDVAGRQTAITGRGFIRIRNDILAPSDKSLSYLDVERDSLERWQLSTSSESYCAFGFHDACWRLLLLRLGYREDDFLRDEAPVVESLFFQLYCTPCAESSIFQFGHCYDGAVDVDTFRSFGRPEQVDPTSHFYADPFAIPSLRDLIESARDFVPYPSACDDKTSTSPPTSGPSTRTGAVRAAARPVFRTLSLELWLEILSHLSFEELLNARLIETLPQSYWRNRFIVGHEADFLFPPLTEKLNWERLFFGTRASLRTRPLSVVSRKRIRQLLEPIAALVQRDALFRSGLIGLDFCPAPSHDNTMHLIDGNSEEGLPVSLENPRLFSGEIADIDRNGILDEGCRQCLRRIGVSTVQIGARVFVLGINLLPEATADIAHRPIGYRIPDSEKWINIPPASRIKAFWVAFSSEGLRALAVQLVDSQSLNWICESSGPGIARGTLDIPGELNQACIFVGLDCYKIVSLGIGTLRRTPGSSTGTSNGGAVHSSAGSSLGKLTKLVFHMDSRPTPLMGIEVGSADGASTLFGSRGGCEITFFIDGAGGERIQRVGVLEDQLYPGVSLAGLQMSTNYGRTATVTPLSCRLDTPVEDVLLPARGSIITGLTALERQTRAYQTRLTRVGVQTRKCERQPLVSRILDQEQHRVPHDELHYDRHHFSHFIESSNPTNYQTYASLENVRKIRASTGLVGRSRSPSRITGLKFDYYNYPTPGVVGQWMDELDNGFELAAEEEVRLLTIGLTPVGTSRETRGMKVGQVALVHIETTRARSVTFQPPDFHTLPTELMRHQYQSDGGLVAISWILNMGSECVRAIASPDTNIKDIMFVPELHPPFDLVQTIYFERDGPDGKRELLITAEAHFHNSTLIGLEFIYKSGRKAKVGNLESDTHRTYSFPHDARILRMSVAVVDEQLKELEFEMERDSGHSQLERTVRSIKSSDDPIDLETSWDAWRNVWCPEKMWESRHKMVRRRDRSYKAPNASRLVGISFNCLFFEQVGAIYQPESDQ
ncbi:hypothetical protein BJY00DRAFT_324786 [Aspergillus carlsbadensis]|nr:hypothetical protein BJY00DRAFT_324786 [Aspergillus carlsbadensis]